MHSGRLLAQVNLKEIFFQNNKHVVGNEDNLYTFIGNILPNVYVIAGIILFIYFLAGGFFIVSSAGNPDSAKNGQKIITNAIIGFIILFTSFWIIQIIETVTGVRIFNPSVPV